MKKNFINLKKQNKKLRKDRQLRIYVKSKNNIPIRVLYKKTGEVPKTKIINNVYKLKKAIVDKNLEIIPYEKLYIICNKKNYNLTPNIILPFYSIYGDLLLVDIDKNEREFKGLSQEDIIWYSQDLLNKSANNTTNLAIKTIKKSNNYQVKEFYERDFLDSTNNSFNFEKTLIDVLVNIELVLATILKSEDKK